MEQPIIALHRTKTGPRKQAAPRLWGIPAKPTVNLYGERAPLRMTGLTDRASVAGTHGSNKDQMSPPPTNLFTALSYHSQLRWRCGRTNGRAVDPFESSSFRFQVPRRCTSRLLIDRAASCWIKVMEIQGLFLAGRFVSHDVRYTIALMAGNSTECFTYAAGAMMQIINNLMVIKRKVCNQY